ncbi:MAG: ATP-dependent zinc protease [Bdellovibrionaceae bacterium]|nr:ATP-dependent zinc protease [Pseudobdellovibrionaceae bacterium]|tara:strand:+ start:814 stop:1281 length:468 start_codon:yes stop_codon:yes gene_type:complete
MIKKKKSELKTIGWREWVELPLFDVSEIKVKVDSGARTSALHVSHLKKSGRNVIFTIHPNQHDANPSIEVKAHVLEYRWVKSSNGSRDKRPVVRTKIKMGDEEFPIEITLVNRDMMGFRMLLGREAIRKRFLIDTGSSFLLKKRKKSKTRKVKKK